MTVTFFQSISQYLLLSFGNYHLLSHTNSRTSLDTPDSLRSYRLVQYWSFFFFLVFLTTEVIKEELKPVSLSTSFICDPRLFLHHWNIFETEQILKALSSVFHDTQLLSLKRRAVTEKDNSTIIFENYLCLRSEFFQLLFQVKSWNIVSVYFVSVLPNMWKAFLLQCYF